MFTDFPTFPISKRSVCVKSQGFWKICPHFFLQNLIVSNLVPLSESNSTFGSIDKKHKLAKTRGTAHFARLPLGNSKIMMKIDSELIGGVRVC